MNVRVQFAKYNTMKFIGHLDVMRYFQKAVRRSGLDIMYSQGYHPHQIMSFASPLGVGITSDTEFMDLELKTDCPAKELVARLDAAMTDGFSVTGCRYLPDPENGRKRETAMSLITCADYLVSLKDGYSFPLTADALASRFAEFAAQEHIMVTKEVKKSNTEQEMDLKPFLFAVGSSLESFESSHPVTKDYYETTGVGLDRYISEKKCFAEHYESGKTLTMRLSAGSATNIKPELVLEAFCTWLGMEFNSFAWQIHRFGMYTGTNPEFMTLI